MTDKTLWNDVPIKLSRLANCCFRQQQEGLLVRDFVLLFKRLASSWVKIRMKIGHTTKSRHDYIFSCRSCLLKMTECANATIFHHQSCLEYKRVQESCTSFHSSQSSFWIHFEVYFNIQDERDLRDLSYSLVGSFSLICLPVHVTQHDIRQSCSLSKPDKTLRRLASGIEVSITQVSDKTFLWRHHLSRHTLLRKSLFPSRLDNNDWNRQLESEDRLPRNPVLTPYLPLEEARDDEMMSEDQEPRRREQQFERDAAELKDKLAQYLMDDIQTSKRSSNNNNMTQTLMTSESAPAASRRRQGKTERNFQTQGW